MRRRLLSVVSVLGLVGTGLPVGVLLAEPAAAASVSFTTTGVTHTWTVPTGVQVAQFRMNGAAGADGSAWSSSPGNASAGSGGTGAAFATSLNVAAGESFDIGIGVNANGDSGGASGLGIGAGGDAAVQGGGGGGGATIVKQNTDLIIVAGGGGGGGGAVSRTAGAAGGNGGSGGVTTAWQLPDASPGAGGTSADGSTFEAPGGGGGTVVSGGAAGNNFATAGTSMNGGTSGINFGCGGGGGGAGAYGGGGGGATPAYSPNEDFGCGGGGGGASYIDPGSESANSTGSDSSWIGSAGVTINTIAFTTTSLANAMVGAPYSQSIATTAGIATTGGGTVSTPNLWSVSPALPTGLTLDTSTGVISGTPSSTSTATYTVTASVTGQASAVLARTAKSFTLTVDPAPAAPTISSVLPASGPVIGGISITISGQNLANPTSVKFGTTSATVTYDSATQITATLPAGFGAKDVSVTTAGGIAIASGWFTYAAPTISGVSPAAGSALGGMSVYVDGDNLTYATGVTFGGVAGQITNVTDDRLTVLTPASSVAGAVNVVLSAQGTSDVTASGAFTYTASKPTPPTIGTATAGPTSATVTWTANATGGSVITGYTVMSNTGNKTCTTTGLSCTVTGLTAGSQYTFSVTSTNAVGTSNASGASNQITAGAAAAPGAPTGVTASAGVAKATVSWTAPAFDGGSTITGYTVTSNPGGLTCPWTSGPLSCDVTGLTANTTYTFTVTATNAIGTGSASSASAGIVALWPTIGSLTPSTGGANGGTSVVISGTNLAGATAATFDGVAGTITATTSGSVTVTTPSRSTTGAVNVEVTVPGPASVAAGNAFTYTAQAPNAPTNATAVAGIESATISWSAPALDGGSAITGYTVVSTPGNQTCAWTSGPLSCEVTGLTPGTSYTFTVTATNGTGTSLASAASNSVTALAPTAPGVPTGVSATVGVRQATVTWTAPASTGGSTITGYTVTASSGGQTCTWSSGPLSCVVTGLTNLGAYTFTVTATNAVGTGNASSPSPSVTLVAPTISSGGVGPNMGTALGGTQVTITGTNLANPSSVTFGGNAATIQSSTSGSIVVLTSPSTSSGFVDVVVTVNGVTATAVSGFGYTQSGPSAPTNVAATLTGSDGATITWTASALPGSSPITGYDVTSSPAGLTCSTTTATTCSVTGITVGTTYTFTVVALNIDGPSVAATSNAVVHASGGGGSGGGSGSGGGGGSSVPTPAPAPTTSPTTPPSPPTRPAVVPATVPGLRLPARITVPGTTVLVPRTLRTADGVVVTARASVRPWTRTAARAARNLPSPAGLGARIVKGKSGRISVVTTGRRAVIVTLRLTAPATTTSAALDQKTTWRVPAKRS